MATCRLAFDVLAGLLFLAGSVANEDNECTILEDSAGISTESGQALLQMQSQRRTVAAPGHTPVRAVPNTGNFRTLATVETSMRARTLAVSDRSRTSAVLSGLEGFGTYETLDDRGFNKVSNSRCQLEMELYVRRVVHDLGLQVCHEEGLLDLLPSVVFFDNFTALSNHIARTATPPADCAFVALPGSCPATRARYCMGDPAPAYHRRRQCKAKIQRGDTALFEGARERQCKLPKGAVWCEVRLVDLEPFWIAVYDWNAAEDWVSYQVCQFGYWEERDTKAFGTPGHLLDVGGNIGYWALAFAHAGWTVTTFEPMKPNLAMIYASLCRNPSLARRVHVNEFGLGVKPQKCRMMSPENNVGDGFTRCSDSSANQNDESTFKEIGIFDIRRLDDVLLEQGITKIDLVKIDVEGSEYQVFAGAPKFFSQYNPRIIRSEVWEQMIGFDGPASGHDYLGIFEHAGYSFFNDSKCKDQLDTESELATKGAVDVYMCKVGA